jgi:lipopolysaccharide export system permease protein
MSSLNRYIFRQLAGPVFLVTVTLTGVVWLTQSLRFLDLIINRGLSTTGFLYLTA